MKRITWNMTWVVWFLLLFGLIFIGVGTAAFVFARGSFESLEDERIFRYVFLGVFGGTGTVIFLVGLFVAYRFRKARLLADRLMSAGNSVWADVVDITLHYNMNMNGRSPSVLRCTYRHTDGQTYMFKSKYLRYNPKSLLKDGKVKVWLDPYDIRQYYVDVEGSMKEPIIEI